MKTITVLFSLMFAVAISSAQTLKVIRDDGEYTITSAMLSGQLTHLAVKNGQIIYSGQQITKQEFTRSVVLDGVKVFCPPNCSQFNAVITLTNGSKKKVRGTFQMILSAFPGTGILEIRVYSLCPLDCSNGFQQL